MTLLATVRKLQPRETPYADALGSFRSGVLSDAIDGLRRNSSVQAIHLLARTWLRIGNASEALAALDQVRVVDGADRAEHAVLRAAALSRLGHHDAAHEQIEEAIVRSISSASAAHEAEAFYYRGVVAFGAGDIDAAEVDAQLVISVPESLLATQGEHVMPLETSYARGFELAAVVQSSRSDFRAQIISARRSYELAHAGPDRWIEATALLNLLVALRDVADSDAVALAATLAEPVLNFPWTPDLSRKQQTIYDALGTLAAIVGDNVGAFRWYRHALDTARCTEDRLVASLQRAFLAHELDQDVIAREELEHTLDISGRIDWNASSHDFRLRLLALAITAAPLHTAAARNALTRYGSIESPTATTTAARYSSVTRGLELLAAGIVSRYEGNSEAAISLLEASHAIWTQIGFSWRITQTAVELAELGVAKYSEEAIRTATSRPNSWLGRRAKKLIAQVA